MIDATLLRAMLNAGCSAEQIVAVAEDAARAAEEKKAARRTRDTERQRRYRARNAESQMSRVTACDIADNPSPEVSPHTPFPNPNPIPPSPPKGGSSPTDFDAFWAEYPNKVGKRDAEKAFATAVKRAPLDTILAGVRRYAAKTDDRPWCNPSTFLNQDRWKDQPAQLLPPRSTAPPKPKSIGQMWVEEARIKNDEQSTGEVTGHLEEGDGGGQGERVGELIRTAFPSNW